MAHWSFSGEEGKVEATNMITSSPGAVDIRRNVIMTLSSKCQTSLQQLGRAYLEWKTCGGNRVVGVDASTVSSWLCCRRRHYDHRWSFVVDSDMDFRRQLRNTLDACDAVDHTADFSAKPRDLDLESVLVMPGWGQQHDVMGRKLYAVEKIFREEVDRCDAEFKEVAGYSALKKYSLFVEGAEVEGQALKPAMFFYQAGAFALLRARGVNPVACVGSGLGDVCAAYAAGALSRGVCLRLLALRMRAPPKQEFLDEMNKIFKRCLEDKPVFPRVPLYSACGLPVKPDDAQYWADNVTSKTKPDMTSALRRALRDCDTSRVALVEVASRTTCLEDMVSARALTPAHPGVHVVPAMDLTVNSDDHKSSLMQISQLYQTGYQGKLILETTDYNSLGTNYQIKV